MMKTVTGFFAGAFAVALPFMAHADGATPVVSNMTVVQDSATRKVEISYELDSPAIVTMDFFTNGVSIGA